MPNKDWTTINEIVEIRKDKMLYVGEVNSSGQPNGYGFKVWNDSILLESYYENGESIGIARKIEID